MIKSSNKEKYIPHNIPTLTGKELYHVAKVLEEKKFSGDNGYSKKCSVLIEDRIGSPKIHMTTSGTHALEMAAMLTETCRGDEIIMPSFTFTSTATAFSLHGAKIVFVDIRPDTMNIDENKIEAAITDKTKAIVVVHYAGVSCDMDKIVRIAKKYNLYLIEDAAQALFSSYKGQGLGTIGHFGCFSFHETKNFHCGEGGAISVNRDYDIERSEIVREKGTNRSKFYRGEIDKYGWVDQGSSYLLSEINSAFLYDQLVKSKKIIEQRLAGWKLYSELFKPLEKKGIIETPKIPKGIVHNAHIYYIKCRDQEERQELIGYLWDHQIKAVFHYLPLHTSIAGKKFGKFIGEDKWTTKESERLLRLPLFHKISRSQIQKVAEEIFRFYKR